MRGAAPTSMPPTRPSCPPGGFFTVPAGVPHYTRAGDGEVIYQENGYGPSPTKLLTE